MLGVSVRRDRIAAGGRGDQDPARRGQAAVEPLAQLRRAELEVPGVQAAPRPDLPDLRRGHRSRRTSSSLTTSSSATSGSRALKTPEFAFGSGAGSAPRTKRATSRWGSTGSGSAICSSPARLAALDARFRAELAREDAALAERFEAYRAGAPLSAARRVGAADRRRAPAGGVRGAAVRGRVGAAGAAGHGGARGGDVPDETLRRPARQQEVPGGQAAGRRSGGAARGGARALRRRRSASWSSTGDEELTIATVLDALIAREKAGRRRVPELDLFERWAAVHRFVPAAHAAVARVGVVSPAALRRPR